MGTETIGKKLYNTESQGEIYGIPADMYPQSQSSCLGIAAKKIIKEFQDCQKRLSYFLPQI